MDILERMAKRDDIITKLYSRTDIIRFCQEHGGNWADDMKSYLFELLCEMDEDKLIDLDQNDKLVFWIFATLEKMCLKSSTFQTKVKGNKVHMIKGKNYVTITEDLENAEHISADNDANIEAERLERLPKSINALGFFHNNIIEHYLKNGNNITKTARALKVNREYVGKLLKESKRLIKKHLEDNDNGK